MTRRRVTFEARIAQIKAAIAAVGDLRPGTLSQQYNVCGKPDCRCKATPPKKHGPYYQLSFTWQGKSQSQFVRRAEVPTVRQQVRNYQRLRTLVDTWVGVAMELSRLRLQEARASREKLRPAPRVSGQTRDGRASSVSP